MKMMNAGSLLANSHSSKCKTYKSVLFSVSRLCDSSICRICTQAGDQLDLAFHGSWPMVDKQIP